MQSFDTLQQIILSRRSTKPSAMNGKEIDTPLINQLLELANWAPTHAFTEPWRFIVYHKEALRRFCLDHANLYKTHTAPEKFVQAKYDNLLRMPDTVSHAVVVYMQRTPNARIPAIEEVSAVAAAIQNILLGAQALGISVLWSTGGMTHHHALKQYLSLADEDIIMGLLYMGYTDEPAKEGKRNIPLEHKVFWK